MSALVYVLALVGAITAPIAVSCGITTILAFVAAPRGPRKQWPFAMPIERAMADRKLALPSDRAKGAGVGPRD